MLKVLHEAGVPIHRIVGVSAGSMIGAMYAANPDPKRLEKIVMSAKQSEMMNITLFRIRHGFVTGKIFRGYMEEQTDGKSFEELDIPLVAVAVDLETGELVSMDQGVLSPAINASCALPPVFHPVEYNGRILVDGGAVDPVPVNIAKRYPHDVVIAVNITQQLKPKMPTNAVTTFMRYHRIRLLAQSLMCSERADIMIHPYVGDTGIFDTSDKAGLLAEGERAAREQLPHIESICFD